MNDQPTPESGGGAFGASLWVKVVLVASLAVNFAVVGVYLGQSAKEEPRRWGSDRRIHRVLSMVPEARKAEATALMDEKRKEIRALRGQSRKARQEWMAAVTAEPFSADRLMAAVDARIELSMKRRAIVYRGMAELLERFSPEERAEYAARMKVRIARWKKRREARRRAEAIKRGEN